MIRVLLFAALRELAGTGRVESSAPDVASLVADLSQRFGPEFTRIVATGTVVVDGERAGPARTLAPGSEVALLPPVSGGQVIRRE